MEGTVGFNVLHDPANDPNTGQPFRFFHGRRYHNVDNAKYVLPNDNPELDRIVYHHYMLRYALGKCYFAPVEKELDAGIKVLDVGCGPGVWVCEMASIYVNSQFHGVDLCPVFPDSVMPHNVRFSIANLLTSLPFKDGEFDYVNMRSVALGLGKDDWEHAIKELVRVCKPGGWIEIFEQNAIAPVSPTIGQYNDKFFEWLKARNIDYKIIDRIDGYLEETKVLQNIHKQVYEIPVGKWGGLAGQFCAENVLEFMRTEYDTIGETLGMTMEEFEALIVRCKEEFNDDSQKGRVYYHSYYAQKIP